MLILGKDVQVQVESLCIVSISHLPGQIKEVLQHIVQVDLHGELIGKEIERMFLTVATYLRAHL